MGNLSRRVILSTFACVVSSYATAQFYRVDVIPDGPDGEEVRPLYLNNLGFVTGSYGVSTDGTPFKWSVETGMVSYSKAPNSTQTDTRIIGDDGVMYGLRRGVGYTAGFRLNTAGTYTDLQNFFYPRGINASGVISGSYDSTTAAIYDPSTGMHILSHPGQGYAIDINDNGVAVGIYSSNSVTYGRRWEVNGTYTDLLAPSGFSTPTINTISNSGIISGAVRDSNGFSHATYWTPDGVAHFMGNDSVHYGFFSGINDSGLGVGVFDSTGLGMQGVIWSEQMGIVQLESVLDSYSTGWKGLTPRWVNNKGQILGTGYMTGTTTFRNLLFTPVPEPTTTAGLALGALALLRKRKTGKSA